MFDVFPKALSSIASFLFPLFASYKALKTSDPAQLTPWLMYWVVLACVLLVESWTEWLLVWIPFYAYIRLLFLLYLVLPQTQGARIIYQTHVHPFLSENETQIEDFIASAHDRLRAAGIAYLKRAIELLKTKVFNLPPGEAEPPVVQEVGGPPQSYTQSLLARFSLPSARWSGNAGTAGVDFYSLLAGAVGAVAGPAGSREQEMSASGTLIPPTVGEADRASFIATQRERLSTLLSALDREAAQLGQQQEKERVESMSLDGNGGRFGNPWTSGVEQAERPVSRGSALSKSRSEADFEKIDAESGAEEVDDDDAGRRRTPAASGGSWMPWGAGWRSGETGKEHGD